MTMPLGILAGCTVLLSLFATPVWPWFHSYLSGHTPHLGNAVEISTILVMLLSAAIALGGISLGWWLYSRSGPKTIDEPDPLEKLQPDLFGWLRGKLAALPQSERGPLDAFLDQAESAVDAGDFTTAISAVDAFRTRVQARAGQFIPNEWRATHDVDNQAGDLVAGANTLRFSVAYLRDFGQ